MPINIPFPIDIYIAAENAGDQAALAGCFTQDAIVRDEGRTYEGLDAIMAWKAEGKAKYNHTAEPLAVVERDGKTIVTCKVTGTFPGSPIELDFGFRIENGKIAGLEIH